MRKVGKSVVPYMTYEHDIKSLKQEDFKRLCRVPKRDFLPDA